MTYLEAASQYAAGVLDGSIPAAKPLRLAVARWHRDLERQGDEDFPYVLDEAAGDRVCAFIELTPHTKGRWARARQKFILEPFQVFIVFQAFGWVHRETRARRFRRIYIEIPRKNGKSALAAVIAIYLLVADLEEAAEVYCGATTIDQAREVWNVACRIIDRSPELRRAFGLHVGAKAITSKRFWAKLEPLSGRPKDGSNPHGAIIDEYHEHPTSRVLDTMELGMGAREQPLSFIITTAGSDSTGPCYQLRSDVLQILQGSVVDETTLGIIYTIDEEDDWASDEAILKANPNAGVSVSLEALRIQRDRARRSPTAAADFKTKILNVWVSAKTPYLDAIKWVDSCKGELTLDDFAGEPCFVAYDLSSKLDLTARVAIFEREGLLYVFPRFWLPETQADEIRTQPYREHDARGNIKLTPGPVIDYEFIKDDLRELAKNHKLIEVPFDSWNAAEFGTSMMAEGFPLVDCNARSVRAMSEPLKHLQAEIEALRIRHDGNPIMSWCIANVVAKVDANENVFPRKERTENKIDGAVALLMALSRKLVHQPPRRRPALAFA